MKDAYSFDVDEAAARRSYNRMFVAYLRTFARMGLKAIPMRAETGPIGGDLSHEFIVLAETGESEVFCDRDLLDMPVPGDDIDYDGDLHADHRAMHRLYAATEDVHDAARFEREVPPDNRLSARGIEVGQIFYFGTKYSVADEGDGRRPRRRRACRSRGLLRRRRVAPGGRHHRGQPRRRRHHLAGRRGAVRGRDRQPAAGRAPTPMPPAKSSTASSRAKGVDVLYDDTDERPGGKFATADLIGMPWQSWSVPRAWPSGVVELKRRSGRVARESSVCPRAPARLSKRYHSREDVK